MVDSPFNEYPKNENLRKRAITGTPIVMQIRGCQFRKRMSGPTPWYQNSCDASNFLHAGPNFRKKVKKLNFQAKF